MLHALKQVIRPRRTVSRLLTQLALSIALSCSLSGAEPILTNEKVFYVPFNVPAVAAESMPKLIELFVSGDQGRTWHAYQQRNPREGRFVFNAGGDGVYFFATRSVNQNGQAEPKKIERKHTELVVAVDRTQPKLETTATAQADGQVVIQWATADKNLAAERFYVKYRSVDQDENGSWQPIELRGNTRLTPEGELVGQVSIWPPAGSRVLQIQAIAQDRAGNQSVVDRELALTATPPNVTQRVPTQPLLAAGSPPTASIGPVPPANQSWPSEAAPRAPAPHRNIALDWSNPNRELQPKPPVANGYGLTQPPPIASRQSPGEPSIDGPAEAPGESFSNGPSSQYRLSQSRRFHLDYDVESGNEIDVYRVEIWSTIDGGQSWQHLGDDEDRISPYLVNTDADGMYGFRLIVQSKEGLAARPPQSGDPPDVWVRVDATAPATRLTSARFGRGADLGKLQITWEVRDEDLADQPISLLYSSQPNGPWRNIARDLANTGSYDWQVDDRIPLRVYLRLEARDRAGNTGADALRDAIKTDSLSPKGFIRNVRPAAHAWPIR